jgi:hypothetical protein
LTDPVFVSGAVQLELAFATAQARLANLARGGWLLTASRRAYREGVNSLTHGGLLDSGRGVSRLVSVYCRDLIVRPASAHLAIRWVAAGPGQGLYPALDADITLAPAGKGATTLTLAAVYRFSPRNHGNDLDRAALRPIADVTIRALINRIAEAMAIPSPAPGPNGQITGAS